MKVSVKFLASLLLVTLTCTAFGAEVSRLTNLLSFLNTNVATDNGNRYVRLHPAYYGAEILSTLDKHPGYIQSAILSTDFTQKLKTSVSGFQIRSAAEASDFGGFQNFVSEKKEFNNTATVINSYLAGRVLEISSLKREKSFALVDSDSALKFLEKSLKAGVYALYPDGEISVTSVLYGSLAYNLWHKVNPRESITADKEATLKFLSGLYSAGGFAPYPGGQANLESTHDAVKALQTLNLWESFLIKTTSAKTEIPAFVRKFNTADGVFAENSNHVADIASTYFAVIIAQALKAFAAAGVSEPQVTEFVMSLQSEDGGFKLRRHSNGGQYVNTFYAIQALEALGKSSALESIVHRVGDNNYQPVKFIPTFVVWVMVVLIVSIVAFAVFLLFPVDNGPQRTKKAPESKTKVVKQSRRKKHDATITLIRDNKTKKCVDKDGEAFPVESLNRQEWDILSQEDKGTHTVFVMRKRGVKTESVKGGRKRK